ncbi:MAG: hypothetical protein ACTSUF_02175 [Candidatus Heimdallarchaeaceae archaeon]
MTIRTSELGGTDWSDGDVLTSADLNDTIEALAFGKIHLASGNSQLSTSSTGWTDVDSTNAKVSFTLSKTRDVLVFISMPIYAGADGTIGYVGINIDGTVYEATKFRIDGRGIINVVLFYKKQLDSGTHTASISWKVKSSGHTLKNYLYTGDDQPRYQIIVIELPQIQT